MKKFMTAWLSRALPLAILAGCGASEEGGLTAPSVSYRVDVFGSGTGSISSSPAGINCVLGTGPASGTCAATFVQGTSVALTATPGNDWEFVNWAGAGCGAAATCQFVLNQAQSISASFDRVGGPGPMRLDLTAFSPGTGGLVLIVSGGLVSGVTAAPGYQIRTTTLGQSPLRLLVRGTAALGKLADLQVADRKAAFTVTVQSASAGAGGGYALLGTAAYQAVVSRP